MSVAVIGMFSVPSATLNDWSTRTLRFQRVVSSSVPRKSSERPLKHGVSPEVTVTWVVLLASAPLASVTVSSTTYLPTSVKVWLGFSSVEVPPSPNVHA